MPDKGNDKQEAILDTALTLFTERGFFGTPTSLISKEAGVATGTLFFYFRTKEDLIDTLYCRIKAEAAAAMCRGIGEEPGSGTSSTGLGQERRSMGGSIPGKDEVSGTLRPLAVRIHDCPGGGDVPVPVPEGSRGGRDPGGRDPGRDPHLIFSMMATSLSGLGSRISCTEDPGERENLIEEGLDIIWNGLRAGPDGDGKDSRNTEKRKMTP